MKFDRFFLLLSALGLLLVLSACGPTASGDSHDPAAEEGDDPNECRDGVDNDDNGLYDCDDPGCVASPDCTGDDDDATPPGDDDDATPPGDDDDATPPGDDDDATPPGDDDDDDDVWFEVCNYLDNYEDLYTIYSWAPGDQDWVEEFDSILAWGDCQDIGPYWPDYWIFTAMDEFEVWYCTGVTYVDSGGGYWPVDYSYDCE
jgi:hypothetical protein